MVEKEEWSIREIHTKLMYLYNQGFAFEYVHMVSEEEKHWIEEQVEALASNKYSKADM
jgi:2-oxoglutarate dehydrogenase E1 component